MALKQQLRRIMKGWRDQTDKVTAFKKQIRINLQRLAFRALDKHCGMNYRFRLFANRRNNRKQEQVIIALLQNLERVRRVALSS